MDAGDAGYDDEELSFVEETETVDGVWSFDELALLAVGNFYYVQEVVPDGWTQTEGNDGYVIDPTAVGSGETSSGNDFGNFEDITISGFKYEDTNGNRDQNGDETNPDVEFTIKLSTFVDAGDAGYDDEELSFVEETETVDGVWSFDELALLAVGNFYYVQEVVPDGWTQTEGNDGYVIDPTAVGSGETSSGNDFGNFEDITISGFKYEDTNGNRDQNGDETNPDVEFTIKLSTFVDAGDAGYDDEELSFVEETETVDGVWSFDELALLAVGNFYYVQEVVPDGWTQTEGNDGYVIDPTAVGSGETSSGNDFGNFEDITISGFKYEDTNGNRDQNGDETNPDVEFTIKLSTFVDAGDAGYDDEELSFVEETETVDGVWSFDELALLAVGNFYYVQEVVPDGWTQTEGNDGYVIDPTAVGSGETSSGNDFGNFEDITISGFKYEDTNGNRDQNGDETNPDVEFTIKLSTFVDAGDAGYDDEELSFVEETETVDGVWSFDELALLAVGNFYYVQEVVPDGWTQTEGNDGYVIDPTAVGSGETSSGNDFGNFEDITISGFKYEDTNGNRDQNGDETNPDVEFTIKLSTFVDAGDAGYDDEELSFVEETETVDGVWSFDELALLAVGNFYYVQEVVPDGWTQTEGNDGYVIDPTAVGSGETSSGNDFGNFEDITISGFKYEDTNGNRDQNGDETNPDVEFTIKLSTFVDAGDAGYDDEELSFVEETETVDGVWSFDELALLAVGNFYYVQEVVPDGWTQTEGNDGYVIDPTAVGSGETSSGNDFGNFEDITISGFKYEDTNGNRDQNGDETNPDVEFTIKLSTFVDAGDAGYDDEELSFVEETETVDGVWSFDELALLAVGNFYYVQEVVPDGWTQTEGNDGYVIDPTAVGSGETSSGNDFGNFEDITISGFKYEDTNGNRDQNGDETNPDVEFTIKLSTFVDAGDAGYDDEELSFVEETETVDGVWSFDELALLAVGNFYYVQEVVPDGWTQTEGNDGYVIDPTAVGSGETSSGNDFGNFEDITISGFKYEDTNGNRDQNGDETNPDVEFTIKLSTFVDAGDAGYDDEELSFVEETETVDGVWSFDELALLAVGNFYYVQEVVPDGWTQTEGNDGYVIDPTAVGSGETSSGNDFGNFEDITISGFKYEDTNGNRDQNGDETNPDVEFTIKLSTFVDAGDAGYDDEELSFVEETETVDGVWSFDELALLAVGNFYYVQEVVPDGWTQTEGNDGYVIDPTAVGSGETSSGNDFGNFEDITISGFKYEDTNGNRDQNGDETNPDVEFTIKLSTFVDAGDAGYDDEELSFVEETETVDGVWSFDELALLAVGNFYYVQEVVPDGWTQTEGNDGYVIDPTAVGSGETSSGNDFGNFEDITISGFKYEDTNGNRDQNGDETNPDVEFTIKLSTFVDAGDAGYDDEELSFVEETETVDGVWSFDELALLAVGNFYYVQEVVPDGWTQTEGNDGYVIDPTAVGSGETSSGNDFGNFEDITISGFKYEDTNGNRDQNGDETNPDVEFTIKLSTFVDAGDAGYDDEELSFVEETETVDGVWSFDELALLAVGNFYYVQEVVPDGWTQTEGNDGYVIDPTAVGSGGESTDNDFGNFENVDISGFKWADINGDGFWTEGETGLGGFTIVLDDDMDSTNGTIRTVVTNTNGSYSFENITPSDFGDETTLYVYELEQDGFVKTYGNFSFNIESGLVIEGESGKTEEGNFGNAMLQGANRTPGFWQSTLGQSFYDGIDGNEGDANGDGFKNGDKDFEEEGWSEFDLLNAYGIDTDEVMTRKTAS